MKEPVHLESLPNKTPARYVYLDKSIMKKTLLFLLLAVGLLAVGCTTVRDAREAQREKDIPREMSFGPRLSLAEAERISLDRHPAMITATQNVVSAEIALHQAGVNLRPALSASASYGGATTGSSETDWHFDSSRETFSVGASLTWVLYDFGRTDASQRQAAAELIGACENYRATVVDRVYQIRTVYFDYAKALAQRTVAEENLAQYVRLQEQAELRMRIGSGRKYDVTKAKAERATAAFDLVVASNTVVTSRAALLNQLSVVDAQPFMPEETVLKDPPTDMILLLSVAATNQPAIQISKTRVEAASKGIDYAVADLYPQLKISASPEYARNASETLGISWGVSILQDLFKGWQKQDNIKTAVAAYRQAKADLVLKEQQMIADATTSVADYLSAREAVAVAVEMEALSKENLDLVQEQFNVGYGAITILDVTDAQVAYTKARVSSISSRFACEKSKARIYSVIGITQ